MADTIIGSGEYRYRFERDWAKLPRWWNFGEAHLPGPPRTSVKGACAANGDVYVVSRSAHPITVFDAEGRFITSWGEGEFSSFVHGMTIDRGGKIWITDTGLHTVTQHEPDGTLLRTLGERHFSSPTLYGNPFNMPTGVAFASDGSFFVSDGYGNSRVMKFGADGSFIMQWGSFGDGPGQFNTPHGIAIGPDGNVYVADRGNARVQIFDQRGTFLGEWKDGAKYGRPWALAFNKEGHAFIVDGGDQPAQPPDRARIIEVDIKGTPVSTFGSYGNQDGQMIWPHSITIDKDDAIYVGEVGIGRRVQKFVKR